MRRGESGEGGGMCGYTQLWQGISCIDSAKGITDKVALGCPVGFEEAGQMLTYSLSTHIYSGSEIINDREEEQLAGMQAQLGEVVEERESEVLEDWSSEVEGEDEGNCHNIIPHLSWSSSFLIDMHLLNCWPSFGPYLVVMRIILSFYNGQAQVRTAAKNFSQRARAPKTCLFLTQTIYSETTLSRHGQKSSRLSFLPFLSWKDFDISSMPDLVPKGTSSSMDGWRIWLAISSSKWPHAHGLINSTSLPKKNLEQEGGLPGEAENGLLVRADVLALGGAWEIDRQLRVLCGPNWFWERLRGKGTSACTQMITMTEIKKALAVQNSILKKENEMLKRQEEELDAIANARKKKWVLMLLLFFI